MAVWSSELHAAAAAGDGEAVGRLLREGRSPDERGGSGSWIRGAYQAARTPLHYACRHGHLECVRLLLVHGADPNAADEDGYTPLHYLCQVHSPSRAQAASLRHCAAALLQFGARPRARTGRGYAPLHLALTQRNDVCRSLLEEYGTLSLLTWALIRKCSPHSPPCSHGGAVFVDPEQERGGFPPALGPAAAPSAAAPARLHPQVREKQEVRVTGMRS